MQKSVKHFFKIYATFFLFLHLHRFLCNFKCKIIQKSGFGVDKPCAAQCADLYAPCGGPQCGRPYALRAATQGVDPNAPCGAGGILKFCGWNAVCAETLLFSAHFIATFHPYVPILSHSEPRQRAKNPVYCECRTIWMCAYVRFNGVREKSLQDPSWLTHSLRMTLIWGWTWDLRANVAL